MKTLAAILDTRLIRITLVFASWIAAMMTVYSYTSPLFPWAESDYAVFRIIGRSWIEGVVPYRDIMDNKGPVHFLLQVIGLLINDGKWGIFIINAAMLTWATEMMWSLGVTLNVPKRHNIIGSAVFMFIVLSLSATGDTCEELSLPFIIYPLCTAVKYGAGIQKKILLRAFLCGMCLGTVLLIRINNSAAIAGICIGLSIVFILTRQYRQLVRSIMMFIIGTAVVIIPMIIYFASVDALSQTWECLVTYSMRYRDTWPLNRPITIQRIIYSSTAIIGAIMAVIYDRKNNTHTSFFIIPAAIVTFITFLGGTGYRHYYIMAAPFAMTAILMTPHNRIAIATTAILCVVTAIDGCHELYHNFMINTGQRNHFVKERDTVINDALSIIPINERDSVYMFNNMLNINTFFDSGNLPVGKYPCLQSYFCATDTGLKAAIHDDIIRVNPKWLVASDQKPLEEQEPMADIAPKYEHISNFTTPYDFTAIAIYRRKDN